MCIEWHFSIRMEKGNLVPIHKKNNRQCLEKSRPVLLISICGNVWYLVKCSRFFLKNGLISQNHSRFKPGDACINQLLFITHEIYKSFDDGFDVRSLLLNISKAFDKAWNEGIIFKLKQNGIPGEPLNSLCDILRKRKQRVDSNGQVLTWANVIAGVLLGLILAPLFFWCT